MKALVLWAAAQWCVTRGHVDGSGRVGEPPYQKMRAVFPGSDGNDAELRFTWLGPSVPEEPLASGLPRRQVGLKLRAQDPCNLVYVMWRMDSNVVVSVKRNPGQTTSRACGNAGYRNLRARAGVQPPPPAAGSAHTLRAAISGRTLRVFTDGSLAWEGDLDDDTLSLTGPAGVRSDNGRFELEARAWPGPARGSCGRSAED